MLGRKYKWVPDTYKDCEERVNEIITGTMRYKKIRQEDVASALDISRSSVGNKTRGDNQWTLKELYIVFDLLKISDEDILKMFGRKVGKT